ncbi:MAG: class II aldolase/adducin family protein [Rickettsiaceae bacterium]|nr:class II aldolase/adducin family protein [Rickettsiaceae bacterium]
MDDLIKKELALAYQILAYLGLDDHTYTHLSSKSSDDKSYYIYPFGLRFEEVSHDKLIRSDFEGNVLEGQEYQYNKTGYIIHGQIYKHRHDIETVFHLHTPEIVAVSAYKEGLLPISQWALHFYNKMSYHDYDSLALQTQQGEKIASDLGANFNMLMRNHGSINAGKTIYEALFYAYHLQLACKTQIAALSQIRHSQNEQLITPNKEICIKSVNDLLSFEENLGKRDWDAWVRKIRTQNFTE